jgi:predicted AlkP superfamily phosphohydrolase/phosphomutase
MNRGGKKLLLIGIDQAIPYLINKFIKQGSIPNIAKLCENGVSAEAFSCAPCDTPTNWTTIATGARTATHGATSFYMHLQGEPLDLGAKMRSRTQLSRYCQAEFLWDVAERNKLIPFVINYPSGWPSNFRKGAMSLFTWLIPESNKRMVTLSKRYNYYKNSEKDSTRILEEGDNLKVKLRFKGKKIPIFFKIIKDGKILLTIDDLEQPIDKMEWSQWFKVNINIRKDVLPCLYRIKITEFNDQKICLERSAVYNTKGWTNPEIFGEKLIKNVFEFDFPQDHDVEYMVYDEMSSYLISARNESIMLTEAIKYAKRDLKWDFCYFHYHPLDSVNHDSLAYLHKESPLYTEENAKLVFKNVETAYEIVDEMVGNLIDNCVDNNTIVVFISDHGAIPIWKIVNIPLLFMRSGLTNYNWNEFENRYRIDWKNSKVFPYMEPPFVWINLKGRDPHGIVNDSEYEDLRDLIIDVLYSLKDPDTNERIIELALRKEEAEFLGLNGERVGDIIYFLKPPYGIFDGNLINLDASIISNNEYNNPIVNKSRSIFGAHAYYLPSTRFGDYSISVPFVISGPGIKKDFKIKGIVDLIDIVPTLSYLLNIPKTKNSEGRILYEMME